MNSMKALTARGSCVRSAVHVGMGEFLGIWQQGKSFDDFPHLAQAAKALLDDLAWWAKALQRARAVTAG